MKCFTHYLFLIWILACGVLIAENSAQNQNPILDVKIEHPDIWGEATSGLKPCVSINKDAGWYFYMDFVAQTNFSAHTWLNITNRVRSKLELWQTNGVPVLSKNTDVLDAFHLPNQTTVSEIMKHSVIPRAQHAYQWFHVGRPMDDGTRDGSGGISLQSAFDISFTNDYVLQITPLLYKVDTNEVNATLVEFPPIKIKLMADGHVQKLE
jgi:hypothetical protein